MPAHWGVTCHQSQCFKMQRRQLQSWEHESHCLDCKTLLLHPKNDPASSGEYLAEALQDRRPSQQPLLTALMQHP